LFLISQSGNKQTELSEYYAQIFKTLHIEILNAIDEVINSIGKKGIWALDRCADRRKLFVPILQKEIKFVVRMTTQRDMINSEGRKQNIAKIAKGTRCSKKVEITIHPKGDFPRKKMARIGFQKVSFTFKEDKKLTLVVIKGMGKEPIMLLTNLKVEKDEDALWIMKITLQDGSVRNPSDSLKMLTSWRM